MSQRERIRHLSILWHKINHDQNKMNSFISRLLQILAIVSLIYGTLFILGLLFWKIGKAGIMFIDIIKKTL